MNPRDLLPWRSFIVGTRWSPPTAVAELRKHLAPIAFGLVPTPGTSAFVGTATSDTELVFQRRPAPFQRSAFRPVIRVSVVPALHGGAHLHVRMRLSLAVAAFMAVWMSGATVAALIGLIAFSKGQLTGLLALPFLAFGALVGGGLFAMEARDAERVLRAIYASAPEPSAL